MLKCYVFNYNKYVGCQFDGGDCFQLCNFTKCNIETMANGNCDAGCNNTECGWDGGDCNVEFGELTVCNNNHGFVDRFERCNVTWVGDGWYYVNYNLSFLFFLH